MKNIFRLSIAHLLLLSNSSIDNQTVLADQFSVKDLYKSLIGGSSQSMVQVTQKSNASKEKKHESKKSRKGIVLNLYAQTGSEFMDDVEREVKAEDDANSVVNSLVEKDVKKEDKQELKKENEEIKEQAKDEVKEEVKEEAKEEPKEQTKESPKEEAKEGVKLNEVKLDETKEETKETVKEESKDSSKEEKKVEKKEEKKETKEKTTEKAAEKPVAKIGNPPPSNNGATVSIALKNNNNEQYIGQLSFGDSKQQIPVMFDTGSPMIYVLTDNCGGGMCPQDNKFSPSLSSSFKKNGDGDDEPLAYCYGKGCVTGSAARDKICFSQEGKQCLQGATMLAVTEATDVEKDKFSGLIGLGPKSDVGRVPAFVEQMANLGGAGGSAEIAPMFSIFLSNKESQPGQITFGGFDVAQHAKSGLTEKDVFWAQLAHKSSYFWVVGMGAVQFSDGKKLEVDAKHAILDSGLSYALIPSEDFSKITNLLGQYGVKCAQNKDKTKENAQADPSDCTCKEYNALPALKIPLLANREDTKGKIHTMPRETYIKDSGNGKCKLLLNPNDMQIGAFYGESYWLLGDQFMQSYYTIYDLKGWQVGLVQSNNEFASDNQEEGGASGAVEKKSQDQQLLKSIINEGGQAKEELKK